MERGREGEGERGREEERKSKGERENKGPAPREQHRFVDSVWLRHGSARHSPVYPVPTQAAHNNRLSISLASAIQAASQKKKQKVTEVITSFVNFRSGVP